MTVIRPNSIAGISSIFALGDQVQFLKADGMPAGVSIAGTVTFDDVTNVDSIGIVTARAGVNVGNPTINASILPNGDANFLGSVGIGTQSPGAKLHIAGATSGGVAGIWDTAAGGARVEYKDNGTRRGYLNWDTNSLYLATDSGNSIKFSTNAGATQHATIDSSGRLLVGTSTARAVGGESNSRLQIEGSGPTSNSWVNITRFADNAAAPAIQFGKSRSDTPGTYTVVQSGDVLGTIAFAGADGTDLATYGAKIAAEVDGTPGANDMPGRLVFFTTAVGSSTPLERLRIDSSGRLGVGTTIPGELLEIKNASGTTATFRIRAQSANAADGALVNLSAIGTFGTYGTDFTISNRNTSGGAITERFRIDNQGRLLVGTSSWSAGARAVVVGNSTVPTGNGVLSISRGNNTALVSGDPVANIEFTNSSAATYARISVEADGTTGTTSDFPARLMFWTTADGASSPTERMRIDSSGRLGIGLTNPSVKLHADGSDVEIRASDNASSKNISLYGGSSSNDPAITFTDALRFYSNSGSAERMQIDSSGRLLVGTTSTSADTRAIIQGRSAASESTGKLYISSGNNTPADGDGIAELYFSPSNHTATASIAVQRDGGTWTAGSSQPSRLVFSTTPDGLSSPTERMRIHADGGISTNALTSGPNTTTFGLFIGRLGNTGLLEASRNVDGTTAAQVFGGNSGVAYVMGDGDLENTNNRYTGISDAKLKQNIEDASSQWQDIKSIQVRKYELIANPERKHIGCVAQELEQICPGLVIEREDLEGQSYKSVAYSVLYMKAVKALQEAMERIEVLEAKVNALEGN